MKFKQYISRVSDDRGFFPTPQLRWVIRKNTSHTAREEAIAASVIRQANPRENISGHFPWGPEEQMVLQQLWILPAAPTTKKMFTYDGKSLKPFDVDNPNEVWRDVPVEGTDALYSTVQTEHGPLNVPNAVKEPGVVCGDLVAGSGRSLHERVNEILGYDFHERVKETLGGGF